MSKLTTPEADFYEILQARIDELEAIVKNSKVDDEVSRTLKIMTGAGINELKHMQQNFNSYKYRISHKHQAD